MTLYAQQSMETKNKLSNSLKKLMKKKDFEKITINDIVNDCKFNRNSFYYHFEDIYDLLKFTFEKDTIEVIKKIDINHNMEKAILFIMNYIDNNRDFCICAYKFLSRNEFRRFLKHDFEEIITKVINTTIEENHYHISNDFKEYILFSYTELIVAHLMGYLENDLKIPKERIVNYIILLFDNSMKSTLEVANNKKL